MVKIAEALLGRRQNRTNKQEYHKATFIKRQVDVKKTKIFTNNYPRFERFFCLFSKLHFRF